MNQFKNLAVIHLADQGDFLIDEKFTFEIGGKNKKQIQIQNVNDSFIAKDNIEIGAGNVIPVWLFGFLY